jgi:hypothetical protein
VAAVDSQNPCLVAAKRLAGAAFSPLVPLLNPTSLTFLATGELLGLQLEVDRVPYVSLRDDQEQILQPNKTFGLPQNNLIFRDSADFVPVVPRLVAFGRGEIEGGLALGSFSWEALTV